MQFQLSADSPLLSMVQGVVIEDGCIVDVNPSTQDVLAKVPCSTLADVTAAVSRAQAAQPLWAAKPLADRILLLKQTMKNLAQDQEGLAQLITQEMGKIISEAKEEVQGLCDKDDYLDLVAAANADEVVDEASGTVIIRDPHGVVAILSPWNFPSDEIALLALPALAAGNTVVLKPSEVVPLVGTKVAEAFQAVLPAGTFELLQGDGVIGEALVNSGVNMIAMTGSCATGKKIMAKAAPSLKRLVLELGGKDPMVVFADADLDLAADDAVHWSLWNCGQVCCAVERIYVEEAVAKDFEERVATKAKLWHSGDGFAETSKIGPLVSSMQKAHVAKQVDEALAAGKARLVCRGEGPTDGNFYPTTVLADVQEGMSISRDETFGPVVCITAFDGKEGSAVRLSNDSEYGLASYVYTKDLEKAKRVARGIKSGQVGINCYSCVAAPSKCPWIGAKGSGFGCHSGVEGWKQFSVPKSLVFKLPDA